MTQLLEAAIFKLQQLPEAQQNEIAEMILQQIELETDGFWQEFDHILEDCQIPTGISDLATQHDHYLHIHNVPMQEA